MWTVAVGRSSARDSRFAIEAKAAEILLRTFSDDEIGEYLLLTFLFRGRRPAESFARNVMTCTYGPLKLVRMAKNSGPVFAHSRIRRWHTLYVCAASRRQVIAAAATARSPGRRPTKMSWAAVVAATAVSSSSRPLMAHFLEFRQKIISHGRIRTRSIARSRC